MFEWSPASSPKTAESSISKLLLGWFRDDSPEELYFPGCPDPRYLPHSDDDASSDSLSLTPDDSLNTSRKDMKPNASTALSSARLFVAHSSNGSSSEHSDSHSSSDYTDLLTDTDSEAVLPDEGNNPANFKGYAQRIKHIMELSDLSQGIQVNIIDDNKISFVFESRLQAMDEIGKLSEFLDPIEHRTSHGIEIDSDYNPGHVSSSYYRLYISLTVPLEEIVTALETKAGITWVSTESVEKTHNITTIEPPKSGLMCFHL